MIKINNLHFSYAGNEEGKIKDINVHIKKGECVLICGRSGCGKTSILRAINGLIPNYFEGQMDGMVMIDNENLAGKEMYQIAEKVGTVFQNPRTQFFNVDTDSEIAFGMENRAMGLKEMQERLEYITYKLHIEHLRKRNIFELSGGEKQRIAFASVYAMNPDVFLLDEPSSNLDTDSIEELRRQLMLIKSQGKTIVISEHRIYYLMDVVDRILYMENGEIKGDYSRDAFLSIKNGKRQKMGLRSVRREVLSVQEMRRQGDEKDSFWMLDNLTIRHGERILQRDIHLTADKGDIIAIVGKNGTGKTTFLRCICGLHDAKEGTIYLEGCLQKKKDRIKNSYMVLQDVNYELFADSVKKECRIGLKNVEESMVNEILEQLGLLSYLEQHPNTLSGGQKQRLAVAVSKVCGKKVLLFDEPTSGLDFEGMTRVSDLIKEMAKDAVVFVVSHDYEFMNVTCTRVLTFD